MVDCVSSSLAHDLISPPDGGPSFLIPYGFVKGVPRDRRYIMATTQFQFY
jgi:hypothetical protein